MAYRMLRFYGRSMFLSSEELEVLEYLKSWKGNYVTMVEICRSAGGRRRYKESPAWASGLLARLVDSDLVSVNERGHYSFKESAEAALAKMSPATKAEKAGGVEVEDYFPRPEKHPQIVGEDYFSPEESLPQAAQPQIVGDDYFSPEEPLAPTKKKKMWVSPQMETILKKAGKKPGKPYRND